MAISYVNKATGTNTIGSVPTHQVDDLFIIFAAREFSTTPPSVPAGEGWTTIDSGNTFNVAYVCCYKIADSTGETTGTFTNADYTHLHIYRGCKTSGPIGGTNELAYNDPTVYYNPVTFSVTDGSSWYVGFAAHQNGDTSLETPPTGTVNRSTQSSASFEVAGHDTNGGVTGWTTQGVAAGGTTGDYITFGIEILANTGVTGTAAITLSNFTASASGGQNLGDGTSSRLAAKKLSFTLSSPLSIG